MNIRTLKNIFIVLLLFGITILPLSAEPKKLTSTASLDYIMQPEPDWEIMKQSVEVKGIYLTGNTVGSTRFKKLVDLIKASELNAVVIDVKDDNGLMTYRSQLKDINFAGSNASIRIKSTDKVLKELQEANIYPIARIVTFKDRKAGDRFPQLAVKNKSGAIWRDRHGVSWLNPYNKEAWNYIVSVAEEAAVKGFKEVQFDYVRFPTDGDLESIDYGISSEGKSRDQAIADFLTYAKNRLGKKGVIVSADVFGMVTTAADDMHIGQNMEQIAKSADIVCPMVYPSHFGKGSYGVAEPDFEPYKIVNHSMKKAKSRIEMISQAGPKAKLRPWLQDFSADYLPKHKDYGAAEVRAQIAAVYDAGIKEWILWNAANKYTLEALKKK